MHPQTNAVESNELGADDLMLQDFRNPHLNLYDEGPGSNLPERFTLSNRSERSNCEVFLGFVPSMLDEKGIKNLCSKYGQVTEVQNRWLNYDRTGDNVIVKFASLGDAENAIYEINKLKFRVRGKVMKANFKKQRQPNRARSDDENGSDESQVVNDALNGKTFVEVDTRNEFHLPLAVPSLLIEPTDIDDQRMKILLESGRKFRTIVNGCAIYRHSPESAENLKEFASKSAGSFDEKTQEFRYNDTDDFTASKECKNCKSPTIKYCTGCKDAFCSVYCLKEYNRNEGGCFCVTSKIAEAVVKKPNRNSVGRGAKLLYPRVMSPLSDSMCSTDSDAATSTSSGIRQKRFSFPQERQGDHNSDSDVRVKPCDLPKDNKLVVITNVVSNKTVFLRSFHLNDNERYVKYLNDVAEYAKTAPPLDEMPKKGDIVLVQYEGYYYRASIERIENGDAIVNLLELGNIVSQPINNLKKLRQDLQSVQRFVFKALISGMERHKMKTDECLIYLYELLEKRVPLKFISKEVGSSSDGVQCELIVSETNESVTGKLTTLNNIKTGHCVLIQEIDFKPFDTSATEAVVIDNSLATNGIVTVAMAEHMSDMFNMHQRIQEFCKEEYISPYTPRVNEVCLAKCNGQWYRAKLEKSFGDMIPVMLFLDFAMFNKVHVDNMRRMPSEFKFPVYSAMAEIGGLTGTTDMSKLAATFPAMSKVSVAKVELLNGTTDEPTIFFNIPGGLPVKRDAEPVSILLQPRRQLLENLRKKFSAQADD